MCHIFFIHTSVEGHLGCFQVLAITINAAMNIVEHTSLLHGYGSFGPKRGIAGYCGKLIPIFLRNCHTDLRIGCTSLHSHQQWRGILISPHSLQHKLPLVFLILGILARVRWYLKVVLICISLVAKDVENFLKCLSAFLISYPENSLFNTVPHFLVVLFVFLLVSWVLYIFWRSTSVRCRTGEDLFPFFGLLGLVCVLGLA